MPDGPLPWQRPLGSTRGLSAFVECFVARPWSRVLVAVLGLILLFRLCLYLPGASSGELVCLLFLRWLFLLFVAAAVLV